MKLDIQEESSIQPSESLVHEAVSQVVSDNLPSMLSTESMSHGWYYFSVFNSVKILFNVHVFVALVQGELKAIF